LSMKSFSFFSTGYLSSGTLIAAPLLQARRGEWIGFVSGEGNLFSID
jgi:hypothetical protein